MISIRLSEDEYLALRQLCLNTRARSVSDLARDLLAGETQEGRTSEALNELRGKLISLDTKIEQLAAGLTGFKTDSVD